MEVLGMAVRAPTIENKCIKCGKKQPINKSKSTKDWAVYDCKSKCECGGAYAMFINGIPIQGGE